MPTPRWIWPLVLLLISLVVTAPAAPVIDSFRSSRTSVTQGEVFTLTLRVRNTALSAQRFDIRAEESVFGRQGWEITPTVVTNQSFLAGEARDVTINVRATTLGTVTLQASARVTGEFFWSYLHPETIVVSSSPAFFAATIDEVTVPTLIAGQPATTIVKANNEGSMTALAVRAAEVPAGWLVVPEVGGACARIDDVPARGTVEFAFVVTAPAGAGPGRIRWELYRPAGTTGCTVLSNLDQRETSLTPINPPAAFSLLEPAAGALLEPDTVPLLRWQASTGATGYRLRLEPATPGTPPREITLGAVTEWRHDGAPPLPNGTAWRWGVTATNAAGERPSDPATRDFSIRAPIRSGAFVNLPSVEVIGGRDVALSLTVRNDGDAAALAVRALNIPAGWSLVGATGGPCVPVGIVATGATATADFMLRAPAADSVATLTVELVALATANNCIDVVASLSTAAIEARSTQPGPGAFTLIDPPDNATSVDRRPRFRWSPASGASVYTLRVRTAGSANWNVVPAFDVISTELLYAPPGVALPAAAELEWQVVARDGEGLTRQSPLRRLRTRDARLDAAIELLTPMPLLAGATSPLVLRMTNLGDAGVYTLTLAGLPVGWEATTACAATPPLEPGGTADLTLALRPMDDSTTATLRVEARPGPCGTTVPAFTAIDPAIRLVPAPGGWILR